MPNEAPSLDQDFALVVYNGAPAPGPVLIFDTAVVTSESCSPANAAVDPNETVTVNFGIKNTGTTNTLNLVATLQATVRPFLAALPSKDAQFTYKNALKEIFNPANAMRTVIRLNV